MALDDLDKDLQAALWDEAAELWPPATLWPRVQASLARPAPGSPTLVQPPAGLVHLCRSGDLRGLTLALLAEREYDVFALARRIEDVTRAAGRPAPREGSILPLLHILEGDGLLDARWRTQPHGLRRTYSLSARGRRVRRQLPLAAWVAQLGRYAGVLVPRRGPRYEQHG